MKISIDLSQPIKNIMTADPISVTPDTSMIDIADLFENHLFHHIPVLDENKYAKGIISKSDFHQLQHHFTRLGDAHAQRSNEKIFKSLLASDVMSSPVISLDQETSIKEAVKILLGNKKHSIILTDKGKCSGIMTAYDLLQLMVTSKMVMEILD